MMRLYVLTLFTNIVDYLWMKHYLCTEETACLFFSPLATIKYFRFARLPYVSGCSSRKSEKVGCDSPEPRAAEPTV